MGGAPMAVQIEQTAKRWKAMQAIGWALLLAGVALMVLIIWSIHGDPRSLDLLLSDWRLWPGIVLMAIGALTEAAGRFLAWWHHG